MASGNNTADATQGANAGGGIGSALPIVIGKGGGTEAIDATSGETNEFLMGEAILLQERVAFRLHNTQRNQDLDRMPFQDRISVMMSSMNHDLSRPDSKREAMFASKTRDLLRNSTVKAQLATYLALQAQINRLSTIISTIGSVDVRLSSQDMIANLTPSQLVYLQRSLHTQLDEICKFIDTQRLDGIDGVISSLSPKESKEVETTIQGISQLSSSGREKVTAMISMLMEKFQTDLKKAPSATIVDVP